MGQLFPIRTPITRSSKKDTVVLKFDDMAADEIFETLSSSTTRELLSSLYQQPATASDLAAKHDLSLQNTKYHIDKLSDGGLVKVGGTWYSERGNEMNVYAPTKDTLILFQSISEQSKDTKQAIKQVIGVLCVLGLFSYLSKAILNSLSTTNSSTLNLSDPVVGCTIDPSMSIFIGGCFVLLLILLLNYMDII